MGFKFAMYPIGYQGIWYDGKRIRTLEEVARVTKDQGWDGIVISGKRPLASVLDRTNKDWKVFKELCNSLSLEIPCWETYSNFMGPTEESREANMIWISEILKASAAMEITLVKIFAGWGGIVTRDGQGWYEDLPSPVYFRPPKVWNMVKEGITEACNMADEYGITLGLQNHPPPFEFGYGDCLSMVKEINHPRLKMVLDVSNMFGYTFFDRKVRNEPKHAIRYISDALRECKDYAVHYTHLGGDSFIKKPNCTYAAVDAYGAPYNWEHFVKEWKTAGFDGWFAYENCGPNVEGGKYKDIAWMDERAICALGYLRQITE
jgi:sugar phosphate isomerase/epimerase